MIGFAAGLAPVILKTVEGLAGTRRVLIDVGRSFKLTPSQQFWKILLPAALPSIFVGLRLGLIFAMINIVGVEFLINFGGLGQLINELAERYDLPGHLWRDPVRDPDEHRVLRRHRAGRAMAAAAASERRRRPAPPTSGACRWCGSPSSRRVLVGVGGARRVRAAVPRRRALAHRDRRGDRRVLAQPPISTAISASTAAEIGAGLVDRWSMRARRRHPARRQPLSFGRVRVAGATTSDPRRRSSSSR